MISECMEYDKYIWNNRQKPEGGGGSGAERADGSLGHRDASRTRGWVAKADDSPMRRAEGGEQGMSAGAREMVVRVRNESARRAKGDGGGKERNIGASEG